MKYSLSDDNINVCINKLSNLAISFGLKWCAISTRSIS